jgi:hypothetical protein
MSLRPATDRDVVTVAVPMHNRADVVGKSIESIVRRRDVGADRSPFSTTSFDKTLTPVGGQHLRDSDLDRHHVRLLGTADVESAIEWPNAYDAALSGAAT